MCLHVHVQRISVCLKICGETTLQYQHRPTILNLVSTSEAKAPAAVGSRLGRFVKYVSFPPGAYSSKGMRSCTRWRECAHEAGGWSECGAINFRVCVASACEHRTPTLRPYERNEYAVSCARASTDRNTSYIALAYWGQGHKCTNISLQKSTWNHEPNSAARTSTSFSMPRIISTK